MNVLHLLLNNITHAAHSGAVETVSGTPRRLSSATPQHQNNSRSILCTRHCIFHCWLSFRSHIVAFYKF